jgi:hypothetical protein
MRDQTWLKHNRHTPQATDAKAGAVFFHSGSAHDTLPAGTTAEFLKSVIPQWFGKPEAGSPELHDNNATGEKCVDVTSKPEFVSATSGLTAESLTALDDALGRSGEGLQRDSNVSNASRQSMAKAIGMLGDEAAGARFAHFSTPLRSPSTLTTVVAALPLPLLR